jgi:hypothetical protein
MITTFTNQVSGEPGPAQAQAQVDEYSGGAYNADAYPVRSIRAVT